MDKKNCKFKANVLTLFPESFPGYLALSNAGKALQEGVWDLNVLNIRDYSTNKHKKVDDEVYGGGAGMLIKADVLGSALEKGILDNSENKKQKVYYLSPRGKVFNQKMAEDILSSREATFVCGHYEGVDQRFLDYYDVEEISLGDFVLSGGEPALMVMLDAVVRLIDGVIDSVESHQEESFQNALGGGNLLEYPHYTRPAVWNGLSVPEILISGHHKKIDDWRLEQAEKLTKKRRPDLWKKYKG